MNLSLAEELVMPPVWRPQRRHLRGMDDLSDADLQRILDLSVEFAGVGRRDIKKLPTLRGRTVLSMFFESSTRTSSSFELAAKRLSADVIAFNAAGSSVDKGETLRDTVETLSAYDPDVIVMRHPNIGAPTIVAQHTPAHVVNAGDGRHEHPTQCLLDLFTIRQAMGRIQGVHVAIVGDVLHSRVARSNIRGLVRMGARVTLVGPPTLVPPALAGANVQVSSDIADIAQADVVYVLRMQLERMAPGSSFVPSLREYTAGWGVTAERVKPHQLVMHPGPMNRGVEIAPDVADAGNSLVLDQVRNGLYVRMAALYDLVTHPGQPDSVPGSADGAASSPALAHSRVLEVAPC